MSHMSSVFIQITHFLHHIICNSIGHPTMGNLAKKIGFSLAILVKAHFEKKKKDYYLHEDVFGQFSKLPILKLLMKANRQTRLINCSSCYYTTRPLSKNLGAANENQKLSIHESFSKYALNRLFSIRFSKYPFLNFWMDPMFPYRLFKILWSFISVSSDHDNVGSRRCWGGDYQGMTRRRSSAQPSQPRHSLQVKNLRRPNIFRAGGQPRLAKDCRINGSAAADGIMHSDVNHLNCKNKKSKISSSKLKSTQLTNQSTPSEILHHYIYDQPLSQYHKERYVHNYVRGAKQQLWINLKLFFSIIKDETILSIDIWVKKEWIDELLKWDPADYNGLETIRLPCDRLWLPDVVLYNNADDYTRGYMRSKAMVSYQGKVFWPPPTKFRSTCPVDVTYFPFDDQTCTMKLGSWAYDGFQVDVTNRTADVDLTNYIPNGEWELLNAQIVRNVIYYSCCPEPFPDVTITITIRRKTLYYMYNVVLPCMMMSVLTLLVFCLPPDSGEKIALGVTVLLAFSVFMLAIAEKMPETSESIPLIGS
ncbi:unnamed protein product, partial [Meganyctiphanes norvegica]